MDDRLLEDPEVDITSIPGSWPVPKPNYMGANVAGLYAQNDRLMSILQRTEPRLERSQINDDIGNEQSDDEVASTKKRRNMNHTLADTDNDGPVDFFNASDGKDQEDSHATSVHGRNKLQRDDLWNSLSDKCQDIDIFAAIYKVFYPKEKQIRPPPRKDMAVKKRNVVASDGEEDTMVQPSAESVGPRRVGRSAVRGLKDFVVEDSEFSDDE
ncbi:hypothetical protein HYFRA_00012837 [Hymenoscyphus fraxineus]|uniref:Uncharacterized protein n=1 Tax=Hymenoscyphus fraxineus TaxID=746836 RepID=A0A9N9L7Q0_9HELO|nr:hypothetical protein HYFRA_00012837 [Hymenoscyphus fraxineus]